MNRCGNQLKNKEQSEANNETESNKYSRGGDWGDQRCTFTAIQLFSPFFETKTQFLCGSDSVLANRRMGMSQRMFLVMMRRRRRNSTFPMFYLWIALHCRRTMLMIDHLRIGHMWYYDDAGAEEQKQKKTNLCKHKQRWTRRTNKHSDFGEFFVSSSSCWSQFARELYWNWTLLHNWSTRNNHWRRMRISTFASGNWIATKEFNCWPTLLPNLIHTSTPIAIRHQWQLVGLAQVSSSVFDVVQLILLVFFFFDSLTLLQRKGGTGRRHYLFVLGTESRHQTGQHLAPSGGVWARRRRLIARP